VYCKKAVSGKVVPVEVESKVVARAMVEKPDVVKKPVMKKK
jgi:hypothetical protein